MTRKESITMTSLPLRAEILPPRSFLMRTLRLRLRLWAAIIFAIGISISATMVISSNHQAKINQVLRLNGLLGMDTQQLHDFVISQGLTVYWVGPEREGKYLINASNPFQVSIRYLPRGQATSGTRGTYRDVETFVQKDGFDVVQQASINKDGVGFINVEGNSIYYNKLDPSNVFVGIKGKDLQIQIFDPQIDQSLALAIQEGRLIKIG
jgi:hypothetical protein